MKEVYVLELQSGSVYVGLSANLRERLHFHALAPNAWVQHNGGLRRIVPPLTQQIEPTAWELQETLVQMLVRGCEAVRGAQYTSAQRLSEAERDAIARTLCQHADACFRCGTLGCRARSCAHTRPASWLPRFLSGQPLGASPLSLGSFTELLQQLIEREREPGAQQADASAELHVLERWQDAWAARGLDATFVPDEGSPWDELWSKDLRGLCIVECAAGRIVEVLQRDDSYLLDFGIAWSDPPEPLKIVIDVDGQLWHIHTADVRQEMLHVGPPLDADELVARFEADQGLCTPARRQSRITVMQDPPGSGKTYRLVRLPLFPDYESYLIITKPHSAKEVVHREFLEQLRASPHAQLLDEGQHAGSYWKQLRVFDKTVLLLFLTGDALFAKLAPRAERPELLDLFEGICATIAQHGVRTGRRGAVIVKDRPVFLCAKTLVVMDEATKFSLPYAKALGQLVFTCNSDAVIAGDMLQSIESTDNVLAYALSAADPFPGSELVVQKGNQIRRCGPRLVALIRDAVPWQRFGLPLPEAADIGQAEGTFELQLLTGLQSDRVESVVQRLHQLILELQLLPSDLLCVFLFVGHNPFADALRDALDELWRQLLEEPSYRSMLLESRTEAASFFDLYDAKVAAGDYVWFAILHRSDGLPINTALSEAATRMVSVHAAQGDGRRVVFTFNLSEAGILQCFTHGQKNLSYYSFINVALSRAKELLVVWADRYDDVLRRLLPHAPALRGHLLPKLHIPDAFQAQSIHFPLDASAQQLLPLLQSADRTLVNDHELLSATTQLLLLLRIFSDGSRQMYAILSRLAHAPIVRFTNHREYRHCLAKRQDVPLLCYSRPEFNRICDDIQERLRQQQGRLRHALESRDTSPLLQSSQDVLVVIYALECLERGQQLTLRMDALYDGFRALACQNSLTAHALRMALAEKTVDRVIEQLPESGRWLVYYRVSLGSPDGSTLPHFSVYTQLSYLYVFEEDLFVVLIHPQLGLAQLQAVFSTLCSATLVLLQPRKGSGYNFPRFNCKRLSFVLVALNGWLAPLSPALCLQTLIDCVVVDLAAQLRAHLPSVHDFDTFCQRRGDCSADVFRTLKHDLSRISAPGFVEDALVILGQRRQQGKHANVPELLEDCLCSALRQLRRALR